MEFVDSIAAVITGFNCSKGHKFGWNNPGESDIIVLPFYHRDVGCFRFDPIPVREEVFQASQTMKGQFFPLVSFGPHQFVSAEMDQLESVGPEANILVPNFPVLFNSQRLSSMPRFYSMAFRFRPTYLARANGNYTFARRLVVLKMSLKIFYHLPSNELSSN